MTLLIALRHAETSWNVEGRLNSRTDLPLSTAGQRQADVIARSLARVELDLILASDSLRATQTAERVIARRAAKVEYRTDPRLRELDFGHFEGRTPAELLDSPLAASFEKWQTGVGTVEGCETLESGVARVSELFREVAAQGTTLLVSHGAILRLLLAANVLEMDPGSYRRLQLDNARLAVVRWESQLPRLALLNGRTISGVRQGGTR